MMMMMMMRWTMPDIIRIASLTDLSVIMKMNSFAMIMMTMIRMPDLIRRMAPLPDLSAFPDCLRDQLAQGVLAWEHDLRALQWFLSQRSIWSILSSLNGAIFKHFLSSKYLRWWRSISNVCLFSPDAAEAEMDSEEIAFCCGYFFSPNNSLGIFYNSYAAFHIFLVFSSCPVDVEKVRCSRYMWSLFCSLDAH